jgi:hypothetical protein
MTGPAAEDDLTVGQPKSWAAGQSAVAVSLPYALGRMSPLRDGAPNHE